MKKIFHLYPDNFYKEKANEAFEQGMEEITDGEYGKAHYCFLDAIELYPKEPKYYFFAGLSAYYFQEDKATGYFEKAAMMNIEEMDYQMWYGISLYRDEQYAEAKKVLLYAYSIDGSNEKIIHYLIKVFNRLGDYHQVQELIEVGIGEEAADTEMLYELGYSYLKEMEFKKAEKVLLKSIERDQKNVMSYYFLSRVYCKTGEFDNAIQILNKLADEVETEKEMVRTNIEAIDLLKSF
ncbi:tetratricopeptide repeat protein [[Brevibacterium] frigoritolerans]|nr:tetratricopeptide repeat protein [Peribacillus frigoritolerans]